MGEVVKQIHLPMLSHLMPTASMWDIYYYLHFKEMKVEEIKQYDQITVLTDHKVLSLIFFFLLSLSLSFLPLSVYFYLYCLHFYSLPFSFTYSLCLSTHFITFSSFSPVQLFITSFSSLHLWFFFYSFSFHLLIH